MIDMEELLLGKELPQGGDNLLLVLVSHIQSNVACNTVQVPQRPPPDWLYASEGLRSRRVYT